MKARLPLIAALAGMLIPMKASAQAWVNNRDFSDGIGIRAGNFELHPSVGAEGGYDSNYFRAASSENPIDVYKLRVTPSLTLSTLGERRSQGIKNDIDFSLSGFLSYYWLFPVDSANSEVSKRNTFTAGVDTHVNVFRQRKFGFDLNGSYLRVTDGEGNTDDIAGEGFTRDAVRGGAGVTWRPGGGLFEWRNGYDVTYYWFESDRYKVFDNVYHRFETRGRWRFLPRSALLFDSSYSLVRYTHPDTTPQTDGDIVRTRVGFHGLVTYHLGLLGMVGWGSTFYEKGRVSVQPRQFDSILANAEARWFIQSRPDLDSTVITSGLSSVAVGYQRSFANSYYGSFYQRDRGYLQFSMFILGAVAGGLEFGLSRVAFPEAITNSGMPNPAFSQTRIDSRAFAEYRVTDTIGVNATVQYDQASNEVINDDDLGYSRFQAYLGARAFW